ncbi:MAG: ribosome maturation factor RimM [Candidatus Malihini olakiniferum]
MISKRLNPLFPVNPIVIGKTRLTYGIQGWLKLFSSTEKKESIFNYQPWYIKFHGSWTIFAIENWKHHNQGLIIKPKGIDDRDTANLLTNTEIVVGFSQLPDLEEGSYYWKNLFGCEVITSSAYQLGKVINMIETGSNDVMVIKANLKDAFSAKERLIPFLTGQVIKHVDLSTKIIEVDWDPSF